MAVSVLPTPDGPTSRNTPIGRRGSARLARAVRMRWAIASRAWSWPMTRSLELVLQRQHRLDLVADHLADRDAGPAGDDLGDRLAVDDRLHQRRLALQRRPAPSCFAASSPAALLLVGRAGQLPCRLGLGRRRAPPACRAASLDLARPASSPRPAASPASASRSSAACLLLASARPAAAAWSAPTAALALEDADLDVERARSRAGSPRAPAASPTGSAPRGRRPCRAG